QYVFGYYGTLFLGAVVVQTNPLYVERELINHINDSQADTIVCLDLLYPRIRAIRDKVKLKRIIVTGIPDYLPYPKKWLYPLAQRRKGVKPIEIDENKEQIFILKKLLSKAPSTPMEDTEVTPEQDIAVLQYTGGTTGTAKGVMLTHYNLVANLDQCRAWLSHAVLGKEAILAVVPLF